MNLTDVTLSKSLARKFPGALWSNPPCLAGTVIPAFIRCGKPNCKCAGGELHGPYFYHTRRVGGRLVKTYVPRRGLPAVAVMCHNWHQVQAQCLTNRRSHAQLRRSANAMLRGLSAEVRQMKQARRQASRETRRMVTEYSRGMDTVISALEGRASR